MPKLCRVLGLTLYFALLAPTSALAEDLIDWEVGPIDTGSGHELGFRIDVDSLTDGQVFVSYKDHLDTFLWMACRDLSGVWRKHLVDPRSVHEITSIDALDADTIFISYAVGGAGVHGAVSTDGGASWTISDLQAGQSISNDGPWNDVFALDPQTAFIAYRGSAGGAATLDTVLATTTDSGQTWTPTPVDISGNQGYWPCVVARSTDEIAISTVESNGGNALLLLETDDGGANWDKTVVANGPVGTFSQLHLFDDGDVLIASHDAATEQAMLSHREGGSWTYAHVTPAAEGSDWLSLSVIDEKAWTLGYHAWAADEARVAVSEDGGQTWRQETVDVGLRSNGFGFHGSALDNLHVVHSSAVGGGELRHAMRATPPTFRPLEACWDGGLVGERGQHIDLKVLPEGTLLASYGNAADGTLWFARSDDSGVTWTHSQVGPDLLVFSGTSIDSVDGQSIFISFDRPDQGVWVASSPDSGATWFVRDPAVFAPWDNVGTWNSVHALDGSIAYVAFAVDESANEHIDLALAKTTDVGNSWVTQLVDNTNAQGFWTSIHALSEDHILIAAKDHPAGLRLHETTTGGPPWSNDLITPGNMTFCQLGIDDDGNTFVAFQHQAQQRPMVAVRPAASSVWAIHEVDPSGDGADWVSLAVLPDDALAIGYYAFAQQEVRVALSLDQGQTWQQDRVDGALWANAFAFDATGLDDLHTLYGVADGPGLLKHAGAFTVASPWFDLGMGLAGSVGEPRLTPSGALLANCPVTLSLNNAPPSTPAYLVIGLTAICAAFKGGTLVPNKDVLLALPPSPTGDMQISAAWPTGLPAGLPIFLQSWLQDPGGPVGWVASNAVWGETQG